jgi:hypothetical protein
MASTQSAGTKPSKTPGNGQTKPNIVVIWGDDIGIDQAMEKMSAAAGSHR